MNRFGVNLLDLPDEMLLSILKKLNNIDVLYLLFCINNERLHRIAGEQTFSNTLNFAQPNHNTRNIDAVLDRFCNYILPRINYNVKCLIVASTSIERILLASHYPNLTELKLLDFQRDGSLHYFTDDSPLRHIFKQQIKKFDLVNEDWECAVGSLKDYTKRVYGNILSWFENLEYFNVIQTSVRAYPGLAIGYLPSSVFSSSTLTYLCINVGTLDDCLCLLDGRLKQLTTFVVRIYCMYLKTAVSQNMVDLPHLKCFSLIYYGLIKQHGNIIVRLLHRMLYLEKLTLYLRFGNPDGFIDPICRLKQFTIYMSRLNSFNFYLSTENNSDELTHYLSNNDVKRNYRNIGCQKILDMVCPVVNTTIYHIFTLPFQFTQLESVGNIFPNIVFSNVIKLWVHDYEVPFELEFFVRISRAFPLLKNFHIFIFTLRRYDDTEVPLPNIKSCELIKYPHLTLLDIRRTYINYVEQFLNESITYLPCLSELRVVYEELRIVTNNFTREETQRNCVNVRRLITEKHIVGTKDYYTYFPLV